jgi:hypothetical protein
VREWAGAGTRRGLAELLLLARLLTALECGLANVGLLVMLELV